MSLTTTNDGQHEGEVRRVANALTATLDDLYADNETLRAQLESLTYSAGILNNENQLLSRELTRMKRQRDHYFQCFTAIKAKVGSIATLADEAVKMVEVHAYGEAQPTGNGQKRQNGGNDPVPAFLIKGAPSH